MAATALGEYLKARRARLRPEEIGIPYSGRRRVAGLRREEVAVVAGLSVDYYTRLEQGRERHPSSQVLDALGDALRLDAAARDHLHRLGQPPARHPAEIEAAERAAPQLIRLLEGWRESPAFIVGRAYDFLARNPVAEALHGEFTERDNLLRMIFLDPAAARFHRDWEDSRHAAVASLRLAFGAFPGDPRVTRLVDELSAESAVFAELWALHDIRPRGRDTRRFRHASVGDLELEYESFAINSAPGQHLVIYQASPGSASADALTLLGFLSTQQPGPALGRRGPSGEETPPVAAGIQPPPARPAQG